MILLKENPFIISEKSSSWSYCCAEKYFRNYYQFLTLLPYLKCEWWVWCFSLPFSRELSVMKNTTFYEKDIVVELMIARNHEICYFAIEERKIKRFRKTLETSNVDFHAKLHCLYSLLPALPLLALIEISFGTWRIFLRSPFVAMNIRKVRIFRDKNVDCAYKEIHWDFTNFSSLCLCRVELFVLFSRFVHYLQALGVLWQMRWWYYFGSHNNSFSTFSMRY